MINYDEFADYIRRYAQHHMEENSDLVKFMGNSSNVLDSEINLLAADHQVVISQISGKDFIFVVASYVENFANIYKRIEANVAIPFPNFNDISKHVPHDIATPVPAADIIYKLLDLGHPEENIAVLYSISLAKGIPALLFPSTMPMTSLVDSALNKIQNLMKKEEVHDYFLKKLSISNPGKELSVKNFFSQFCTKPQDAMKVLQNTGDSFYYWSQFCYFLKQDYVKVKDFTIEDINILQSVGIIEVATSYYKTKATERVQKEGAFKILDQLLQNPPYYYNMTDITKFKDSNGVLLLGQYNEKELQSYLEHATHESIGNELPKLLIFKVNENEGYFILKEKVMPLIIRLSSDARVLVRESLIKMWYKYMLDWDSLPEMKDNEAFERCLDRELLDCQPVLYSLLNASFLPVITFEDQTPGHLTLYRNGSMIPLSELLMLNRQELYSDARIKLPFWYTIPVISWIFALINRKPKSQKNKKQKSATATLLEERRKEEEKKNAEKDLKDRGDPKKDRKRQLRKSALEAEKQLVPETSSLDRELEGYLHEWNDRIGKQNFDNLTTDVNALIRDYLRKVLRTLKSETLTMARIRSLAESLVNSPSMMKIHNQPALQRYIELYLVKLVKNLP